MNSKEASFIPLATALAVGAAAASQRCSEYEFIYPDAADAAVVADAGEDGQNPDTGAGPDTDNNGSTDTGGRAGGGYDSDIIAGEDAKLPPSLPPANPVTPPGLEEIVCPGNSVPEGTEAPQRLNFFADDQFGALRMFLGDKNGNGAKKGLAVKDDAVGGYALPEELATLPDIHSPDNTLFKEAGGGVLLFATGDSQILGLEAGTGGKNLGEVARWTNSMEKGNPANETFESQTTIYVQDTSKSPKDEQGVRTMLAELAEAILKQDANLHGAVLAKYGLSKQYTTSGNYNDIFRTKLAEGFNLATFIAVPACEGTINTSQTETRKELQRVIVVVSAYEKTIDTSQTETRKELQRVIVVVSAYEKTINTSQTETRKELQRVIVVGKSHAGQMRDNPGWRIDVNGLYARRQPMDKRPAADYRTRSRRVA